jgi:hypothetical protein
MLARIRLTMRSHGARTCSPQPPARSNVLRIANPRPGVMAARPGPGRGFPLTSAPTVHERGFEIPPLDLISKPREWPQENARNAKKDLGFSIFAFFASFRG